MTPLETFLERFGPWIGLALYIFVVHGIPFLRDKVYPDQIKAAEAREAQIEDERKWLRNMFAEQVKALQAIEKNLVQINADNTALRETQGAIVDNQQIIMGKQDVHHNATMDAIAQMKERTARIDGIAEGKKLPKTGPINNDARP